MLKGINKDNLGKSQAENYDYEHEFLNHETSPWFVYMNFFRMAALGCGFNRSTHSWRPYKYPLSIVTSVTLKRFPNSSTECEISEYQFIRV